MLLAVNSGADSIEKLSKEFGRDASDVESIVRTLVRRGWVVKRSDGLECSPSALVLLERGVARVPGSVSGEVKSAVRWLEPGALELLGVEDFADAQVVLPEPGNPLAPVEGFGRLLDESSRARVLVPSYLPGIADRVLDRLVQGDISLDIVSGREAAVDSVESLGQERLRGVSGSCNDVFIFPGDIPFKLGVFDDSVAVLIHGDEGIPRSLLVGYSDRALAAGSRIYHHFRRRSVPVGPSSLDEVLGRIGSA